MLAKILSGAILGVNGYKVDVEVDVSQGLPSFDIVGLPDSSIKESRERVRTAIKNSGFEFPIKRITVNLAPADVRKEGPYFDLPIAVGLLNCINIIPSYLDTFFAGELSLDGHIKPINGILPMVFDLSKRGIKNFVVPIDNLPEASLISNINVYGISHLKELKNLSTSFNPTNLQNMSYTNTDYELDFKDVKGQAVVKRALLVAAAGAHNALIIGPPGSGKTMMAKRMPSILPNLTFEESVDTTKIYSVSGLIKDKNTLITKRPFRAPHHTISYAALVGGGKSIKPGEISLAHNGILFLDELPEFNRNVLEVLRQPLEEKSINISRASANITYPSNFMLIASMNPCPCGNYSVGDKCTCSINEVARYLAKISGPLLDRIDIHIEAPKLNYSDLELQKQTQSSLEMKEMVLLANKMQEKRYKTNTKFNSNINSKEIEEYCVLSDTCKKLLETAFDTLGLSVRGYHKILKVARTIADLDAKTDIELTHLTEAINYRSLDRKFFSLS